MSQSEESRGKLEKSQSPMLRHCVREESPKKLSLENRKLESRKILGETDVWCRKLALVCNTSISYWSQFESQLVYFQSSRRLKSLCHASHVGDPHGVLAPGLSLTQPQVLQAVWQVNQQM